MRTALLLSIALLVGAAGPPSAPLSGRDFQQLIDAAVAASSDVKPGPTTICVQRELRPPFDLTKGWIKAFEGAGKGFLLPSTGNAGADRSMTAAMSSKAAVPRQKIIAALPRKFLLIGKAVPSECVIPHSMTRGPNWQRDESTFLLTFTRPALANGYAFIDEYEECAGLCGTTFLRVFRKQSGKWTQVARTVLSVS